MFEAVSVRVNAIDLRRETAALQREHSLSTSTADAIEDLYRKFLVLCTMHPEDGLAPSKAMDHLWHEHLADAEKYEADCISVCGYVHGHDSSITGDELERRFTLTYRYFLEHFGIDLKTTSLPASCGHFAASCSHISPSCASVAASCAHVSASGANVAASCSNVAVSWNMTKEKPLEA